MRTLRLGTGDGLFELVRVTLLLGQPNVSGRVPEFIR